MEELAGAKTAKEEKRCYWYNLVRECDRSNLKQMEFAKLHGVKSSRLSKWRSRLKKAALKESIKLENAGEGKLKFLSVKLCEEAQAKENRRSVWLHHESGFKLELEEETNKELLKAALNYLLELKRC